jgi:hypothetical protein
MHAGAEAPPSRWPMIALVVFACVCARQTERPTVSGAPGARSWVGLDVEAGAAARERLSCRRVRERGRVLLEEAVKLVVLCRARARVDFGLVRWLRFARFVEERVDVCVWSVGRRGLLWSLADELCGDHQRGHEILRGRRVKVRRRHGRGRFWRARLLRPVRRALLLAPFLAVGRTVDDGARLVG